MLDSAKAFIYRAKTTSAENVFFYDCMTWAGKIFYMARGPDSNPLGRFQNPPCANGVHTGGLRKIVEPS
eukprot:8383995-Heterocapsa_arctica.AAC.1